MESLAPRLRTCFILSVYLCSLSLSLVLDDDGKACFDDSKLSRHHSHSLNGTDAAIMHLAPPPLEAVGSDFNTIQTSSTLDHNNRNSVSRQSLMGKFRAKGVLCLRVFLIHVLLLLLLLPTFCPFFVVNVTSSLHHPPLLQHHLVSFCPFVVVLAVKI